MSTISGSWHLVTPRIRVEISWKGSWSDGEHGDRPIPPVANLEQSGWTCNPNKGFRFFLLSVWLNRGQVDDLACNGSTTRCQTRLNG